MRKDKYFFCNLQNPLHVLKMQSISAHGGGTAIFVSAVLGSGSAGTRGSVQCVHLHGVAGECLVITGEFSVIKKVTSRALK